MITEMNGKITEMKNRDPLTERIIACAYKVHSQLGPGFKERIYHNALKFAFEEEVLKYETEREYTVNYIDKKVGTFRVDLIVENKVIVEIKAITGNIPKVFEAQILSYLKATKCKVGLLINFGNKSCQIRRLIFKSP